MNHQTINDVARSTVLFGTLFISILLLLPMTLAFQVSPAAKTYRTDQPLHETYTLRVLNDGTASSFRILVDGPLAPNIQVEPSAFSLAPNEQQLVTIRVDVDPAAFTPGPHAANLRVVGVRDVAGQFGAETRIVHRITFLKLYPGAWLDAGFTATAADGGIRATLTLINDGQAVAEPNATFRIVARNGSSFGSAASSAVIASGAASKLEAIIINRSSVSGHYLATAELSYLDPVRGRMLETFTDELVFGAPETAFSGELPSLTSGRINQIAIPFTLRWDEPVSLFCEAALLENGTIIAASRTATKEFAPLQNDACVAFLEVPSISAGNYTLLVAGRLPDGQPIGQATLPVVVAQSLASRAINNAVLPLILLLVILGLLLLVVVLLRRRRSR